MSNEKKKEGTKIPVILIDESHTNEACTLDQNKILDSLTLPPGNILLVIEGINSCIDSRQGYNTLNEYLVPTCADTVALQRMFHGAIRDERPEIKAPFNMLFSKIPDGIKQQEEMFNLSDNGGNFFNGSLKANILGIYEEMLKSPEVDRHIKPILELIKTRNFPYELPGMAGSDDEVNSKLIFLRDMHLVSAIEQKVKEVPNIQIVVVIRGAFHRLFMEYFLGKSSTLEIHKGSGINMGFMYGHRWFNFDEFYKSLNSPGKGGYSRRRRYRKAKKTRRKSSS